MSWRRLQAVPALCSAAARDRGGVDPLGAAWRVALAPGGRAHSHFFKLDSISSPACAPTPPSAAATVAGVQSRPELNGVKVTTKKYLKDKGRYTVQLPALFAEGEHEQVNLKPANLVLAEGSAVVATGLTGAPELNGQRGIVEGWLEEKGRYVVRLEDKRRTKAANLRPENCRADVLAL